MSGRRWAGYEQAYEDGWRDRGRLKHDAALRAAAETSEHEKKWLRWWRLAALVLLSLNLVQLFFYWLTRLG